MKTAQPASAEIIKSLLKVISESNPGTDLESFMFAHDESCNNRWNVISTRNISVILEWYGKKILEKKGSLPLSQKLEEVLEELLVGIEKNDSFAVIEGNRRVPVSISYLENPENWISNNLSLEIYSRIAQKLGVEYSQLGNVLSESNPWIEPALYSLTRSSQGVGITQQIASLMGGPQHVYTGITHLATTFNRTKLYQMLEDNPISINKRRMKIRVYWVNNYFIIPEIVGWHHAIFTSIPRIFSQSPILAKIPGFTLPPADVKIEFPDGDYSGTWEITVDYDITPIDRFRSFFNVGELQDTVANLSAEVLELQRDRKALSEEAEKLAAQLVEEEKARRVYQVRAAQADAVARFLHQTSNLVLQPLASTMIVFEDFLEIIEEVKSEWTDDHAEDDLFIELDQSLERIQQVYPPAQQVIRGYRELFHAFYEIYVSTKPERDLNQDLSYIENLVKNKYILTEVVLKLELDPDVPLLKLEGGVQSIFLELMHNAARHGAKNILVKSQYETAERRVLLSFYNDGEPIPEEQWAAALDHKVSNKGRGFGMADARYILENLNNGKISLDPPDREDYTVLFLIKLDQLSGERTHE